MKGDCGFIHFVQDVMLYVLNLQLIYVSNSINTPLLFVSQLETACSDLCDFKTLSFALGFKIMKIFVVVITYKTLILLVWLILGMIC